MRHIDPTRLASRVNFVRSSLRDAGAALIEELNRRCDDGLPASGTLVPSTFHIQPELDAGTIDEPLPAKRRGKIG